MRVQILGPLRVYSGSREIHIAGARGRALLATLLLNAGDPVPVHTLAETIWGWSDRLPRDPRNEVQKCVSRLRRLLSGTGMPPQLIVTDPNGYRIELPPGSLDLLRPSRRRGRR